MFYQITWLLCRGVLRVLRRWEVHGAENLPLTGGIVIISNHVSYWDPVVIGCAIRRRIFFMAKAQLFRIPVFSTIITALGAFPVRREGADREAIRTALEHLARERVVGIFPEGTRSKTDTLLKANNGAALVALKGQVPILPVAVIGTRGVFGKVRVRFGQPLYFPEFAGTKPRKETLDQVSSRVMNELNLLLGSRG